MSPLWTGTPLVASSPGEGGARRIIARCKKKACEVLARDFLLAPETTVPGFIRVALMWGVTNFETLQQSSTDCSICDVVLGIK